MNRLTLTIFLLVNFISSACSAAPQLDLIPYASGFTRPVCVENAGDERLFIVEQPGKIKIIEANRNVLDIPFLDITLLVNDSGNEQGLLGLAFHPDYLSNGFFYVNYTTTNGSTQISRFEADEGNANTADPDSELSILTIPQPFSNHNGGDLNFGPDGYLYIGMGDGGAGGDPGNRAQNKMELLGKMLRIDIDNGSPYSIPTTNPFVDDPAALPEIWALGLRNPWRFSFDQLTGDLWIGDVGQNEIEEIDFQPATSHGGENYGWRCYEGTAVYSMDNDCPPVSEVVFPVYEFNHSGSPGGCSVTGGMVYRGEKYPAFNGHYFFTDFCGNWIISIYPEQGNWISTNHGLFNPGSGYSSFGNDVNGEIYVAALNTGIIYNLIDVSVNIKKSFANNKLKIFPNPATERITAEINSQSNEKTALKLTISDLSGKALRIIDFPTATTKLSVSVENLAQGFYFVNLFSDGRMIQTIKLEIF